MQNERKFYIDGKWVDPHSKQTADVVNPANEEVVGTITLGDQEDVDAAVAAAKKAFTAILARRPWTSARRCSRESSRPTRSASPTRGSRLERNGGAVVARECRAGAGRGGALPDDACHAEGLRMGKRHRSQPHRA